MASWRWRSRPARSGDVQSLLWSAARAAELEHFDVTLAVAAAQCSSEHGTLLPLHLNLMATPWRPRRTRSPRCRVLDAGSGALAALELVRSSVTYRRYDDIVVLDSDGQCAGRVCIGDIIHGVAQLIPPNTA